MRDVHKLKEKYELSLDTRQIMSLTLVGLIALGGVFVLGVAVGKKLQADDKVTQPVDLLTQLDAKSEPKLTYQDELTKETPRPPKPAPAPPPEPVKPAEVVEAPKPPPPTPPELKEEPVPTRTAPPAEHDAGDLKAAIARAQLPVEATPDGSWTLQLSAYQDKAEADRFASDLRGKGYAPYVVEAQVAGKGTWYRVRMGRFPSKDAAGRYLTDFQRETQISAFVTNAN